MKHIWLSLALAFPLSLHAATFALPDEYKPVVQAVPWDAGHRGTLPSTFTQFADMVIDYGMDTNGIVDCTSAFNTAKAACPDGQALYFPAGTYRFDSALSIKRDNISLVGAGIGLVKIRGALAGDNACIYIDGGGAGSSNLITSGYTRGSTNLVMTTTNGMAVGGVVWLTEVNDGRWTLGVATIGNTKGMILKLTGNNGLNFGIDPPLYWDYYSANSPSVNPMPNARTNVHLRDFTLDMADTAIQYGVRFYKGADHSAWRVAVTNVNNYGIIIEYNLHPEVRQCWAGWVQADASSKYSYYIGSWTTAGLWEDNIASKSAAGFLIANGASGNVVACNYFHNAYFTNTTTLGDTVVFHGNNAHHNLITDNVGIKIRSDDVFGANIYNTIFRNWWRNRNSDTNYPLNNRSGIMFENSNMSNATIANVVMRPEDFGGSTNGSWHPYEDEASTNNTYWQGNFEFHSGTSNWISGAKLDLMASLFRTNKPGYFSNQFDWPPIGSDVQNTVNSTITNDYLIPAQARFFGADYSEFPTDADAPDLFVSFEEFTPGDAINTEAAMALMSKTNGSAVSFVMHATSAPHRIVTEAGGGLIRPIHIGGREYAADVATRAWEVSADDNVDTNYLQWTFAASRKVSYGVEITLTNWSNIGNFYNPVGLESGSTYSVLSVIDDNPITMQCETNSDVGANIAVPETRKLWVTALWDSANSKTLFHFYDRTNMTLLGVSSGATVLNATVTDFRVGILDAHTKTDGTQYRIGAIKLYTNGTYFPVWPGDGFAMPTNLTSTAVGAVIAAASDGDSIILPATNATWTAGVTVAGDHLDISGMSAGGLGTNETVIIADGVFTAFTISGDFNTVSNLQIRGDLATDEADGFLFTGSYNRVSRVYLRELLVALYGQAPGLADNCYLADNWRMGRMIFDAGFFAANYPLAWDSTNFFVIEDSQLHWTSAKNQTGSQAMITSQVGDAFVIRHNYFNLDNASTDPAPVIDFHGESPGLVTPGTAMAVYSNYVNVAAGSVSGQKFIDVRGTRTLIYSNRVFGATYDGDQGISYREEDVGDMPNYLVNNSYVWENYHGSGGATAMPVNDDANITEGVDYFASALSPLPAIGYPHPLRNEPIAEEEPEEPPAPPPAPKRLVLRGLRISP